MPSLSKSNSATIFDRAQYRRTKGAVNLHLLLDDQRLLQLFGRARRPSAREAHRPAFNQTSRNFLINQYSPTLDRMLSRVLQTLRWLFHF
jgi:hypothetical protein